jgi:hypothetical protein
MKLGTIIPVAVIALALAVGGVAQGFLTDRWSPTPDLDTRAAALGGLSPQILDWAGVDEPLDPAQTPQIYTFARRYTQAGTGRSVLMTVAVGRPGRVAVHTPEFCYPGSGFELSSPIDRQEIAANNGSPAQFWTAVFTKKKAAGQESIRIHWSWATAGEWRAPDFPRVAFARAPVLQKLYLVHAAAGPDAPDDTPVYEAFAAQLLTELNQKLFARP